MLIGQFHAVTGKAGIPIAHESIGQTVQSAYFMLEDI